MASSESWPALAETSASSLVKLEQNNSQLCPHYRVTAVIATSLSMHKFNPTTLGLPHIAVSFRFGKTAKRVPSDAYFRGRWT